VIIAVARARDARYVPQLLARLSTETYANQRHIVRALAQIGDAVAATPALRAHLSSSSGLILGDLAAALAELGDKESLPELERLLQHDTEWVRTQAQRAVLLLEGGS
jgi:HEAT repeat protein